MANFFRRNWILNEIDDKLKKYLKNFEELRTICKHLLLQIHQTG